MQEGFLKATERLFRKEYTFYYSVIICMLIASVYILVRPAQYKIIYGITVNHPDMLLDSAYSGIRSRSLLQKAIGHLPFEVNYYWERAPHEEIFGDSLPVRVIVNNSSGKKYHGDLQINSLSSHSYSVDHEDTVQFYEFGENVKRYYGDFRLLKGPAFKSHFAPLIVRFNQPGKLLDSYYQTLFIDSDSHAGTVRLSVIAANPLKGKAFLSELIKQYNAAHPLPGGAHHYQDSLKLVEKRLALFKLYRQDKQQIKTLEVIKRYAQKPLRQFVQLPYIDEVKNAGLKPGLEKFNKTQLEKQHLLAAAKVDDAAVAHADMKLSILKTEISDQINGELPNFADEYVIKRLVQRYKRIIADQAGSERVKTQDAITLPGNDNIHVEATGVNFMVIYMLAVLSGFALPISFAFIINLKFTVMRGEWFSNQTLTEKMKILFGISRSTDA